jgi:protein MpaA
MKRRILLWFVFFFLALSGAASASDASTKEFQAFLKELKKRFAEYGWTDLKPQDVPWEYHRTTSQGRPLFFADFGDNTQNCTLLIAGVHGDEIPTIYVLFKLADHLKENPDAYKGRHLVVAPLINPDGFLASPPTRVNSKGVDLNRNFPTRDWRKAAMKQWKANGNKRYYPGQRAGSENETRFQTALIQRFKPQKILSLHSPLNFYDYDGPSIGLNDFEKWLEKISRETNHPMKKLGVYPGSLGNYAGLEKDIFVVTLELPSSDPRMGEPYYSKFRSALSKFVALGIAERKPVEGSE